MVNFFFYLCLVLLALVIWSMCESMARAERDAEREIRKLKRKVLREDLFDLPEEGEKPVWKFYQIDKE